MRALAIDPSMTAFGYAWGDCNRQGLDLKSVTTGTIRAADLDDLAGEIRSLIIASEAKVIGYEAARRDIMLYGKKGLLPGTGGFATPNASQLILLEIQGAIVGIAKCFDIPARQIPVQTWRAQILGKGNLPREMAKRKAREHVRYLGINARSEDANEATCILEYLSIQHDLRFGEQGS